MSKFIIVYKGPATDMNDMSEKQANEVLEAWNQWMEDMGDALIDVGQPMAQGVSMVDDGSAGTAADLNGYSIIDAPDLNSAKELSKGHPFLSEGKGNYAIDIYELLPVPM